MNRFSISGKILLLLALVLTFSWAAHAQQNTGEITGTVTDASGALIPSASVLVTNTDTKKVVRTIHADSKGLYVAPLLQVGNYAVTISAKGFVSQTVNNLQVDVSSSLKLDFKLAAGETASVTVTDANNLGPDMENGSVSSVITGDEMNDLALNTHNFEQVLQLQPGVTFGGDSDQIYTGLVSPGGDHGSAGVSINGLRPDQNAHLLDGADNLEHNTGQSAVVFPATDAIQQVRVARNSYGAQYGGGGSSQIQVVTKAGGSAYHGNVHFYARNAIFNANDYFNDLVGRPKPEDDQYAYGVAFGGPLYIPHLISKEKLNTFFFYAYEGRHDAVARVTNITNIPTKAELAGTFGTSVCFQYTDPTQTTCAPGSMTGGNNGMIPQSFMDPVAQAYIKDIFSKLPDPNNPTDKAGLILDPVNLHLENEQFVRIDRSFGSRFSAYFRFVYDPVTIHTDAALYSGAIPQFAPKAIPGISSTDALTAATAFEIHATYALTSSTVVEAFASYEPYHIIATPTGAFDDAQAPDVVALLKPNLPFQSQLPRVPTVNFNQATFGSIGPVRDMNESFQFGSNIFHTAGRHSLSFGVNWELYRESVNQGGENAGLFDFAGGSLLQGLANFEVGKAASFSQSSVDPISNSHVNMAEGYVEDDWKILPRLTLNIGVRYSFFQQPEDAANHIGSFDPEFFIPSHAAKIDVNGAICLTAAIQCAGGGVPNTAYDPLNGIVQGGINSPFGKAVAPQPTLNFAPRFGFAMDVYGDGKTSLRGGYGLYYDQTQLNIVQNTVYNNPAYVKVVQFADPQSMANPGLGYNASTTPNPLPAYGLSGKWSTPYTMGYSLGIQQQLTQRQILDIDYSGNVSKHQPGQVDINQPHEGAYIQADLTGNCPGLPAPGANSCVITAANTQLVNRIRPYLGYDAIVAEETNFIANYNALQMSYRARVGVSSRFTINYTWSKGLTDSQGSVTPNGSFAGAPQNSYCIRCEYGPINFDRRHVLNAHYQYTLPFYKRGQHGVYQRVVGGWELTGIITLSSGRALTPKAAQQDPAGVGIRTIASPETERPDLIGPNPNQHAPHTRLSWIGNAASAAQGVRNPFVNPDPYFGRSGNASVGSIRGPGYEVFNLGVFKNIDIRNKMVLQLRVQAFNAFNHVNWQSVDVQTGDDVFGQVTSDRDPREMELGIKFAF
jgi:hypothetical protein